MTQGSFALEMDISEHHKWMYNILLLGKKRYKYEFLLRVKGFVAFACEQEVFGREGVIRCSYLKCKNKKIYES